MNISIIGLLALGLVSTGFFINDVFAEVSENSAYLIEGSGYAVTEDIIRLSEIDMGLSSHQQTGSSIDFMIEDGFVTLDNQDFVLSELNGKFLREGKYIRINGNVESSVGFDTTISFFGRLVEESKDASIYGFTGRISTPDNSYKIIYTAKLSRLSNIVEVTKPDTPPEILTIQILPGSYNQGLVSSYIETNPSGFRYYSQDRITIEPGTSVIFVNKDSVSHSFESGKENYGDRYNLYTPDGRITTEKISPGDSLTITFDEAGFYRLYDPTYPWMKIIVYCFPNVDNIILGTTTNQQGN